MRSESRCGARGVIDMSRSDTVYSLVWWQLDIAAIEDARVLFIHGTTKDGSTGAQVMLRTNVFCAMYIVDIA